MGDNLEKMGRELKCPICLSLFDSAVSLTCNHVFCNTCIQKSMRSASTCPVCKLPFHRREIRPAPHMDNLVNIYKSMEVASGLSLFVSQKTHSTKMADTEKLVNAVFDGGREAGQETPETVKPKRMKGVSSTEEKLKRKSSGRTRGKSSFPTNKRVQVPQSPITETPIRKEKNERDQNNIAINLLNKCSTAPHEHLLSTNLERSHLSPFFWVREEVERPSQQTDVEPLTCTPLKPPSFSDLKDSDDEIPPEVSKEEQPHSKCNPDFFDSEMFEWTQKPCSPELCSNPVQIQANDIEGDIVHGQNFEDSSRDTAVNSTMITTEQPTNVSLQKNMDKELHNDYPGRNIEHSTNAFKIVHKSSGKRSQKTLARGKMETQEAHDALKTPSDSMQCQVLDKGVVPGTSKVIGTSKTRHVQSLYPRLINEVDHHVAKSPAASESRRGNHKAKKLGNIKRGFHNIEDNHESVSVKRKKQMKNSACIIGEKFNSSKDLPLENPSRVVNRSKSCVTSKPKEIRDLTSVFQQKISLNGISKEKMADESENGQGMSTDNVKYSLEEGKINQQKDIPALRKCNTTTIKCAFCHSIEETQDSGQIVHYSEGKLVLASHTGGSVIHSHKNCAVWAPNVYFEDNIVINLEEELTRSRRIKCSLCGVKGAALGCYEKSCRKSFHVPCAKKLKECRWDTDNFVILCPLHASSQLPCEMPTQELRKGKCDYKGSQRSRVAVRPSSSINKWDCGRSSEKIVICCSALAITDKEAISELAKSAGAVVFGSWNASVTHVIASTNEIGACKRTLKVLMGILEGKWVLSIKWVQACLEAKRLVDEAPYEINCDIHGFKNGPHLGRLRLLNQEPKIFSGFKFYFAGEFEPSYKGYLQDLVTTAGGTVLHRKPIAENNGTGLPSSSTTVIVYNIELPANCDLHKKEMILNHRRSDAQALAILSGANFASNSWLLNSIAGHKIQDL